MDNKVNLSRYSCCRVDGYQGKLRDRGWPGCSSEQATVGRNAHIIDILRTGAPVNGIANVDWLSVRRSVATNCSVLPYGMRVSPSAVVTFIEVKPPIVTVTVTVAVTVPLQPIMSAWPGESPITKPAVFAVAIVGVPLLQNTLDACEVFVNHR